MSTLMLVVSLLVVQQPDLAEPGTLSGQIRDINGRPAPRGSSRGDTCRSLPRQ